MFAIRKFWRENLTAFREELREYNVELKEFRTQATYELMKMAVTGKRRPDVIFEPPIPPRMKITLTDEEVIFIVTE